MRTYGATPADFVWDGDRYVVGQAMAVANPPAGTNPSGAYRITTGLYDMAGAAITTVVSDSAGELRFQGDDSLPLDLWVTTIDGAGNLGTRWYIVRATLLGAATAAAADAAEAAATSAEAAAARASASAGELATRVAALEAALASLTTRVTTVEGATANAVRSPNGTVTALEAGTAAQNDARTGLAATHFLLDVG